MKRTQTDAKRKRKKLMDENQKILERMDSKMATERMLFNLFCDEEEWEMLLGIKTMTQKVFGQILDELCNRGFYSYFTELCFRYPALMEVEANKMERELNADLSNIEYWKGRYGILHCHRRDKQK